MELKEKLVKVNDNFTVHMYDNGFMLEINGRTENDEWATAKILCNTVEELYELIGEASTMGRE